ncbi:hypothetical protein JB92DRAFT_2825728 [Gautieria morchelliformis]|nr:hypothetical protein JB92DRAFT_2825728 [Gautieria morchelliformis]
MGVEGFPRQVHMLFLLPSYPANTPGKSYSSIQHELEELTVRHQPEAPQPSARPSVPTEAQQLAPVTHSKPMKHHGDLATELKVVCARLNPSPQPSQRTLSPAPSTTSSLPAISSITPPPYPASPAPAIANSPDENITWDGKMLSYVEYLKEKYYSMFASCCDIVDPSFMPPKLATGVATERCKHCAYFYASLNGHLAQSKQCGDKHRAEQAGIYASALYSKYGARSSGSQPAYTQPAFQAAESSSVLSWEPTTPERPDGDIIMEQIAIPQELSGAEPTASASNRVPPTNIVPPTNVGMDIFEVRPFADASTTYGKGETAFEHIRRNWEHSDIPEYPFTI